MRKRLHPRPVPSCNEAEQLSNSKAAFHSRQSGSARGPVFTAAAVLLRPTSRAVPHPSRAPDSPTAASPDAAPPPDPARRCRPTPGPVDPEVPRAHSALPARRASGPRPPADEAARPRPGIANPAFPCGPRKAAGAVVFAPNGSRPGKTRGSGDALHSVALRRRRSCRSRRRGKSRVPSRFSAAVREPATPPARCRINKTGGDKCASQYSYRWRRWPRPRPLGPKTATT